MARIETKPRSFTVTIPALVLALLLPSISILSARPALALQESIPLPLPWAAGLPVYDHIVIVVEENKDYEQIIGNKNASYINDVLRKEGASLTKFYAEEHHSEGNYFWLFSGSNQHVGFADSVPGRDLATGNLGEELIRAGYSFKGYSEGLPEIGSLVTEHGLYARKHVPWVSFSNVPRGKTVADSSNLRFPEDFPSDYNSLPTVSFVIPNLVHDMHNRSIPSGIMAGDKWLREHIDGYYNWAKQHNSLLILTFDESSQSPLKGGLTDPADKDPKKSNRIVTILAGAHIKHGEYSEGKGVTHVSVLRTLEAMYKLNRSGSQPWNALKAGIADDFVINDVFE
ncbi:MAG TPA: alkaline phosphatase family protein [Terriglobales bacterium]|nr:alkaline phosphatase family protein [Terriglobales bacterium]